MNCIKCGQDSSDYHFHVLQVQTFHVRDMGKNSKIQALGDFEDYQVCAHCAQDKLDAHLNYLPALVKADLLFLLLSLCGGILAGCFWHGEGALRMLGFGMAACGILCIIGKSKEIIKSHGHLASLQREEALAECAWECFQENAPKKNGDNDITYIPVNEETLARKNGDLMILYDLVPENAVEAYKRIHAEV